MYMRETKGLKNIERVLETAAVATGWKTLLLLHFLLLLHAVFFFGNIISMRTLATNCESSSKSLFLGKIYYAFFHVKIKLLIDDDVVSIIHGIN